MLGYTLQVVAAALAVLDEGSGFNTHLADSLLKDTELNR
jgi:hypothetical protein